MKTSPRTVAALGLLVATWTTAAAQTNQFSLNATEGLTDFRTVSVNINETTSAVEAIAVGPNFGSVQANTPTVVGTPSLQPATSAPDSGSFPASLVFGFGLANDGGLVLMRGNPDGSGVGGNFGSLLSGNFATFRGFVQSGDVSGLTNFINGNVRNGDSGPEENRIGSISLSRGSTETTNLMKFADASSSSTRIGSVTLSPVPEPASMAVLGLGLAAMKRRRRCRA